MTLRQLIAQSGLVKEDLDKEIIFFSDEELNQGFKNAQIAVDSSDKNRLLLYPLSGSEVEL